jgi:hypothetical protein
MDVAQQLQLMLPYAVALKQSREPYAMASLRYLAQLYGGRVPELCGQRRAPYKRYLSKRRAGVKRRKLLPKREI